MTTQIVRKSVYAAAALCLCIGGPILAAPLSGPDSVRGSRLFLQCAACHSVDPGGPNRVGPNLAGIFGAKATTRRGYQYSVALAKAGLVWKATSLDAYLKRPNEAVPGTKMIFGGVSDAKARTDIIAYLATLKTPK